MQATVTSHVRALPLRHGIRVQPSGRLPYQCEQDQIVLYWQGFLQPQSTLDAVIQCMNIIIINITIIIKFGRRHALFTDRRQIIE